jgi:hypothetical protein
MKNGLWLKVLAREEKRDAERVLVRKPEGLRPLGKPRRRYKDNIKTYLKRIGWKGVY